MDGAESFQNALAHKSTNIMGVSVNLDLLYSDSNLCKNFNSVVYLHIAYWQRNALEDFKTLNQHNFNGAKYHVLNHFFSLTISKRQADDENNSHYCLCTPHLGRPHHLFTPITGW